MGEMGMGREAALHEMRHWEIASAIRGYRRREEAGWARTRWLAFWLMQTGMADLEKAGIRSPHDLLPLPHDPKGEAAPGDAPTDAEIEELVEAIRRENAAAERQKQTEKSFG